MPLLCFWTYIYKYISHAAKMTGKVICNWIQFTAPRSCSFLDSSKPLCFIRTASITLRQCAIKYGKYVHSVWPQGWYELSWKPLSSYSEMPQCSSLAWKQTYIAAASGTASAIPVLCTEDFRAQDYTLSLLHQPKMQSFTSGHRHKYGILVIVINMESLLCI